MNSRARTDRRSFLQNSLAATGGLLASRLTSISTFAGSLEGEAPVAATRFGKVRGYLDQGINVFKGVRYGADTSSRRFMPPLPPEPWTEVRDALSYESSAPQPSRPNEKFSEDCLFLNVWTPASRDGRKRPVLFYIHGGAY